MDRHRRRPLAPGQFKKKITRSNLYWHIICHHLHHHCRSAGTRSRPALLRSLSPPHLPPVPPVLHLCERSPPPSPVSHFHPPGSQSLIFIWRECCVHQYSVSMQKMNRCSACTVHGKFLNSFSMYTEISCNGTFFKQIFNVILKKGETQKCTRKTRNSTVYFWCSNGQKMYIFTFISANLEK